MLTGYQLHNEVFPFFYVTPYALKSAIWLLVVTPIWSQLASKIYKTMNTPKRVPLTFLIQRFDYLFQAGVMLSAIYIYIYKGNNCMMMSYILII